MRTNGSIRPLLVLSLTAFSLSASAFANVLVVGPGQTYTTIQAAVNAAADGDTILVKPGTYTASVQIIGKGLTIAGDGPTRPSIPNGIKIKDLPAGHTVVLQRLQQTYGALFCLHDSGEMRFEGCDFTGPSNFLDSYAYWGHHAGALLVECTGAAAFEGCRLKGVDGADNASGYGYGDPSAGAGLWVRGTRVAVYDCTLIGGNAGDSLDGQYDGGDGAHLVTPADTLPTFLSASGSSFTAGNGGDTFEDLIFGLAREGDGGHGLNLDASTAAWRIDCTFTPGVHGHWHTCPPVHYGVDGSATFGAGYLSTFNQPGVAMSATSLVREGNTITLTFQGEPGAELYLMFAPRPTFLPLPSARGVVLARARRPVLQLQPITPTVVLDGNGYGTATLTAPVLDTGESARTSYVQVYRLNANGSSTMGGFAPLTVLDSIY